MRDVHAIFNEALERQSDAERSKYLEQACQGNTQLRDRVEGLLRAHSDAGSFLWAQTAAPGVAVDRPVTEKPGAQIGAYKLLEQIGEGGMGLVYMAEQQQPMRRLVALKLVKPGMDSKQVIARFEAERQALAMMDHPNIAKVHDAGTTEAGRPYFAMELVRGIPINEFCNQQKLSVRQRLELFIQVCQAVQHAHQKGIIHRDLKPTNVLVTMNDVVPIPKVIDFGIAKALGQQLTEHTLHTGFTQLVGTPLYMSPEQAQMNQLGVDTRSDVYSLGVLLYELLTGTTPFDKETLSKAGLDEMRRMIREDDPPRPSARMSTLNAQALSTISQQRNIDPHRISASLRGELDWIVMKALEKDRSRRYESASALAADIQRYLSDEPVLACPPTTMYRFQKFARKHKASLTTAAAIAVCLILGTTVSAWQAVRATTAEAQATANEQKAVANEQKAVANAAAAHEKEQEAIKQRDEVKALVDKLAAKEEELQRTLYADHIYMAKEAWDSGNVARVSSLLSQHRAIPGEPDRRGFEWHYLNRLSNLGPRFSIKTPVLASPLHLKLSPDDGRLIRFVQAGLAVGKGQRFAGTPALQVWNLQTGQEELLAPLSTMPANVPSRGLIVPQFSPDATRMAIISSRQNNNGQAPREVKVWDTYSGKEVLSIGGVIGGVMFSPDSKLLFSQMENQTVKLWDIQTGQERLTLQGQLERAHAFTFSDDGKRLAAAGKEKSDDTDNAVGGGKLMIWDVQTGEPVQTLIAATAGITQLVFSPDGKSMLLISNAEGKRAIELWDLQSSSRSKTFQLDGDTIWAYFSGDGTRLIGGGWSQKEQDVSEGYAKMWNTLTGQEMLSFTNVDMELSPDGKRVAISDWANSRTKIFDAQTGQIMLSVAGAGGKLAFSPDSKRLATQAGGMRIWDLETGDEVNHIKGFTGNFFLAFSHDGKHLIGSNQNSVQVWDAEIEQQSARKLMLSGVVRRSTSMMGDSPAVFSADFTRLAGISYKTVKLFDVPGGQELRTFSGHEDNVVCVVFSRDGKRIAAADGKTRPGGVGRPASSVVRVWDTDTGSELLKIDVPDRAIAHLVFSPDGNKLAGSARDNTAKVWDAHSGRELLVLGNPRESGMGSAIMIGLDFTPDSRRLAFAGKILDADTGEQLVALKDGRGNMGFSPDGKRIFGQTRGANFVFGVFDAGTGELLYPIDIGGLMGSVTFSPDGKRLANGRKVWDAQAGHELLSLGSGRGQVAFSPDGHRLGVVGEWPNEVTIYDATPLPQKP